MFKCCLTPLLLFSLLFDPIGTIVQLLLLFSLLFNPIGTIVQLLLLFSLLSIHLVQLVVWQHCSASTVVIVWSYGSACCLTPFFQLLLLFSLLSDPMDQLVVRHHCLASIVFSAYCLILCFSLFSGSISVGLACCQILLSPLLIFYYC